MNLDPLKQKHAIREIVNWIKGVLIRPYNCSSLFANLGDVAYDNDNLSNRLIFKYED